MLHVIHVDTDIDDDAQPRTLDDDGGSPVSRLLDRWRERYPRFTFESVPLTSVLALATIDWAALPTRPPDAAPAEQLRALLGSLPSTTSRADILRLFVRHLLVSRVVQGPHDALLLGCSTTALAELTLAETAKGRGYSLPWQINDGPLPSLTCRPGLDPPGGGTGAGVLLYCPLRELYRKELVAYGIALSPPLTDIIAAPAADKSTSVVSYKDLSIEEVMTRYFEDVEENFPSIVANVVRTMAKLDRPQGEGRCGVCGNGLDQLGDDRWRGEIGHDNTEGELGRQLCYGCERSIRSH